MTNNNYVDDENIIEILSRRNIAVGLYTTNKELERLNLKREHSVKTARNIYLPPVLHLECSLVDMQKFAKNGYRMAVKRFVNVMEREFNRNLLSNFYNNLRSLEIERGRFGLRNFLTKRNTLGTYNGKENRIKIDRRYEESIYHELMHMSSSTYVNGIYYSGFKQYAEFEDVGAFGRGLNEGYTQYMTEKYFLDHTGFSYVYETRMAQHIEVIVGRFMMEQLYLNADLKGLVCSLQMYATEKDILDFITNMDLFSDYVNNKKYRKEKKKEISILFEKINVFIYGTYINKMKSLYSSGVYSFNEITRELVNFRNSLIVGLKLGAVAIDEGSINSLLSRMCTDALCDCEQINQSRKR